jgi:hypothetical protein
MITLQNLFFIWMMVTNLGILIVVGSGFFKKPLKSPLQCSRVGCTCEADVIWNGDTLCRGHSN